jgi:hypothetical protein
MNLLGMKRKLLPFSGPMGGGGKGGGGGGPQQVTSTTTSSNIPEYARPYVENMLQSAQAQIYNDDMTSFRPYEAYSSDPNKYFAEFSPMQQRAQEATYNLQTPGQYGLGSELAGQAGIGGMQTKGQADYLANQALGYGQAGQMYGSTGAEQAMAAANRAQNLSQMYGAQGAGYGAQAAGLAGQATGAGQAMADIGAQGLGFGAMGAGYGGRGAQAAEQGFGAGEQFARQATDPRSVQAYMSPYMQNVVDYQKTQAARDYQIAQQARQAGAVAKGAFGGSRQAIESAEAQRNLMSQLQGIEGMGAQEAFKNAQAQQQFGANLGLQGLQAGYGGLGIGMQGAQTGLQGLGTALQGRQGELSGLGQAGSLYGQGMQGAQTGLSGVGQFLGAGNLGLQGTGQGIQGAQAGLSGVGQAVGAGNYGLQGMGLANQAAGTLGTLGSQQLGAQQSIINAQSTMGGQQQAMEQQKINQAIQDFATQQQYPYMQLGMLNSLLRGLPMQSMSTQQYQASPSYLTQGLGALGTAAGAYKAFGGAGGGTVDSVKGFKQGGPIKGIAAFSTGDVVNSVRAKLEAIADQPNGAQELAKIAQTSSSQEVREMAQAVLMEKQMEDKAAMQVPQVQQMAQAAPQESMGIAALPAPAMDQMAGGGIVAFAEGDLVDEDLQYLDLAEKQRNAALERAGITGGPNAKFKEYMAEQVGALPGQKSAQQGLMMMDYFSNLGTQAGPLSYAALKAAKEVTPQFRSGLEKIKKAEADVMKSQADLANADRLEALGLSKEANALRKDAETNKRALEVAKMQTDATLKAAGMNAARATDLDKTTDSILAAKIAAGAPDNPATRAAARKEAIETTGLALLKVGATENVALANAISKDPQIGEKGTLTSQLKLLNLKKNPSADEKTKIADLEDQIAGRKAQLENQIKRSSQTSAPAVPAPDAPAAPVTPITNKDGTVTIPSGPRKGTYEPQADGTYKKIG